MSDFNDVKKFLGLVNLQVYGVNPFQDKADEL